MQQSARLSAGSFRRENPPSSLLRVSTAHPAGAPGNRTRRKSPVSDDGAGTHPICLLQEEIVKCADIPRTIHPVSGRIFPLPSPYRKILRVWPFLAYPVVTISVKYACRRGWRKRPVRAMQRVRSLAKSNRRPGARSPTGHSFAGFRTSKYPYHRVQRDLHRGLSGEMGFSPDSSPAA